MVEIDHFTPLSRAVASIDCDAYAARFAVYDQAHKALLRRLATAESACSEADIAREEQAFRDAIRRIEFADQDGQPTLVPQDEPRSDRPLADVPLANEPLANEPVANEPVGEAPPAPRSAPVWPRPRKRRETLDVSGLPSLDQFESGSATAPILRLSEPRSLARRVGERMALAVMALALIGGGLWVGEGDHDQAMDPASLRGAESTEPAASDGATDAKAQQPNWLSPEMLYAPPPMPPPVASPLAAAPRADVPLPTPRPGR
jgi:hypothetical protein